MAHDLTAALEPLPPALRRIETRPLFALRLQVPPALEIGETRTGMRRVATVQGGVFSGPVDGLSGHVHPGGTDWIRVTSDGATHLDARITMETRGGDIVMMSYRGVRHGSAEVLQRLADGHAVDPAEYYFRTSPVFETSSRALDWLNRVVAVGTGQRTVDGPLYNIFEIL